MPWLRISRRRAPRTRGRQPVAGSAVKESSPRFKYAGSRTEEEVAIVLYDGVELLDWAGPGEVFEAASGFAAYRGEPAFEVWTVATSTEPIVSQGFARIVLRETAGAFARYGDDGALHLFPSRSSRSSAGSSGGVCRGDGGERTGRTLLLSE